MCARGCPLCLRVVAPVGKLGVVTWAAGGAQNLHNGVCYEYNVGVAGAEYCPAGTTECTTCSGCWGDSAGMCKNLANGVCYGYYPDAPGLCPAGTTACAPASTPTLQSDSSAALVFVVSMTGIAAADFTPAVEGAFVAAVAVAAGTPASDVTVIAVYEERMGGGAARARALLGVTVLSVQFTVTGAAAPAAAVQAGVGGAVRSGVLGTAVSDASGKPVAVFARSLDEAPQRSPAPVASSGGSLNVALVAGVAAAGVAIVSAVAVVVSRRRRAATARAVTPKKALVTPMGSSSRIIEPRMLSVMPKPSGI